MCCTVSCVNYSWTKCFKNRKNIWTGGEVMAKIKVALFFLGHGVVSHVLGALYHTQVKLSVQLHVYAWHSYIKQFSHCFRINVVTFCWSCGFKLIFVCPPRRLCFVASIVDLSVGRITQKCYDVFWWSGSIGTRNSRFDFGFSCL